MASYRKKHIKGKIHRIKPKKSIFRRLWFWIIFLFLIIVFSVFYFAFFYSGVQIKNVVISGNEKVAGSDIENLISTDINNKILGLFDSKSIFLVNPDRINKDILEKFPEIEKLTINKKLPQTLILNVTERKSVGIYCQTNNICFLIDQNGIIFEASEINSENVIIKQASEDSQIFIGQEVVAKNIIDLLLKVEKNLKDNFQINLKEALIASSIRLDVDTNENWKIYFDLSPNYNINSQITKLNLLLNSEISVNQRKNLRYIDLRPKDRAIVCDNKTCGT